jgi:hypothetical protein
VVLQRLLYEGQGRSFVSPICHKTLKHLAFVVDLAPHVMPLAVDLHTHLVEMPFQCVKARMWLRRCRLMSGTVRTMWQARSPAASKPSWSANFPSPEHWPRLQIALALPLSLLTENAPALFKFIFVNLAAGEAPLQEVERGECWLCLILPMPWSAEPTHEVYRECNRKDQYKDHDQWT